MTDGLQFSARMMVSLLAKIFGPSYYDGPRFGRGDPGPYSIAALTNGYVSDRGSAVMLNPQPLPPREFHALSLADAHIHELLTLDRMGALLGGEVSDRTLERALKTLAEIDELCPRWPPWPKNWPPPPPPPWWREEMTATELFVFGSRFLAAADLAEQGKLQESLSALGEKALNLSMRG